MSVERKVAVGQLICALVLLAGVAGYCCWPQQQKLPTPGPVRPPSWQVRQLEQAVSFHAPPPIVIFVEGPAGK